MLPASLFLRPRASLATAPLAPTTPCDTRSQVGRPHHKQGTAAVVQLRGRRQGRAPRGLSHSLTRSQVGQQRLRAVGRLRWLVEELVVKLVGGSG